MKEIFSRIIQESLEGFQTVDTSTGTHEHVLRILEQLSLGISQSGLGAFGSNAKGILSQVVTRIQGALDKADEISTLQLSKESLQGLRNEVRLMAHNKKPIDSIPLYQGRRTDGEAVAFFKKHYQAYILPGQEIIFTTELQAIDKKLLEAIRNECRSESNPSPIGNIEDRTNARIASRFYDGKDTERAIKVAIGRRNPKGQKL